MSGDVCAVKEKVFFIGFNRCGTTSCAELLEACGYRSLHSVSWWNWYAPNVWRFDSFDCYSDGYEGYRSNCLSFPDLPFLESTFPGCKFVLQTRSLRKWLISRRRHGIASYLGTWDSLAFDDDLFLKWILVRNAWYEHVYDYFEGKDSLLVLNIEDCNAGSILAQFLALPEEECILKQTNSRLGYESLEDEQRIREEIDNCLQKYVELRDFDTRTICRMMPMSSWHLWKKLCRQGRSIDISGDYKVRAKEREVADEKERKARELRERKAEEEKQRKRKAKKEEQRKAKEEKERKAKEEKERKAKEEKERKAKEEKERKAKEEKERKKLEERKTREQRERNRWLM